MTTTWTQDYLPVPEAPRFRRAITVEAKPDGLHLCTHEPGEEAVPYMDIFITIPAELVPWFAEVVTMAANRSPLFRPGV